VNSHSMIYFKDTMYAKYEIEQAKASLNQYQLAVLEELIESIPDVGADVTRFILWSDTTIINRLMYWLKELQEASGFYNKSFNTIIEAVLWAFDGDTAITRQTQHQCKISISLIKEFLHYCIPINGSIEAQQLLMNLFILSERPDLNKRSFVKVARNYVTNQTENPFCKPYDLLIDYLFVTAPIPRFLFPYLNSCTYLEYQIVIGILDGKSLRKILPDNLNLTKSENAVLQTNTIQLPNSKDFILERCVLAARIVLENTGESVILNRMLSASKIFKDQLTTFSTDIGFWKSIFRFLCRNKKEVTNAYTFTHFIDFFESQRYYSEAPLTYSVKGRTFSSIQRAIANWEIHYTYRPEYLDYTWTPLPIEKWVTIKHPFSYTIEEITDGKRLLEESENLHHCVFSYSQSCKEGSVHIFSLSKLRNGLKKPFVTIEVRGTAIVQIAGKMNLSASNKAIELIKEWSVVNKLSMNSLY